MSETFTPSKNEHAGEPGEALVAAQEKQQKVLDGQLAESELTQEDYRLLEADIWPDRVEDVNEAHAIANATDNTESHMASSNQRIIEASVEAQSLQDQIDGASALQRIRLARQVNKIMKQVDDVNPSTEEGAEYWKDMKDQRDRETQKAQDEYRAENPQ